MGESLGDLDEEIEFDNKGKKIIKKGKRFHGLLEWILDREGHEYMVEVDRAFLRDNSNLVGLKKYFTASLSIPNGKLTDT